MNFLDVTLDLQNEIHQPYRKPNDEPLYINKNSNHPPHVLKNLPVAVNKRLSELSSNENLFNENKEDYENALKKSGLPHKLKFTKPQATQKKKRNRNRQVIWYTPPFNAALKTNIGKEFLKILDKNFPKNNELSCIFNRKTVKIGYSCTKNLGSIIANHNRKILNDTNEQSNEYCNCRNKKTCPLPKKCMVENIVYKATLIPSKVNYVGMTSTDFKARYRNHVFSFKHGKKSTTLATYVADNNLNPTPRIKWEILKRCRPYQPGHRYCELCTYEKVFINKNSINPKNINKRSDLGSRCIHKGSFALDKIT